MLYLSIILLIIVFLFMNCKKNSNSKFDKNNFQIMQNKQNLLTYSNHDSNNQEEIKIIAAKVLQLLFNKQFYDLAEFVSNKKGLHISNAYKFNFDYDIFINREELQNELFKNKTIIWWDDSIGKIYGDISDYIDTYFQCDLNYLETIYINDIWNKMTVTHFDDTGKIWIEQNEGFRKASIEKIKESFPEGIIADCFFNPSEKYGGADWQSIILVFEKDNDNYNLVGIATDYMGM